MRALAFVAVAASACATSNAAPPPDVGTVGGDSRDTSVPDSIATEVSADVTDEVVTDVQPAAAIPSFDPAPGVYSGCYEHHVSISSATAGAVIHYTTDGSTPTATSPVYGAPVPYFSEPLKLRAIATAPEHSPSGEASGEYRLYVLASVLDPVTFSPPGGAYSSTQTVTLADGSDHVTICYTLDGTDPTCDKLGACTGATLTYTAPLSIAPSVAGTTITATACNRCQARAPVRTATYTLK